MSKPPLTEHCLKLDGAAMVDRIATEMRKCLSRFRRRGIILGLSGGIDSTVTAALAVRALGPERVFGVHMPERDSSKDTLDLSRLVSSHLGIDSVLEEITAVLEATGCYQRQAEAIRLAVPEYGPGWKSKMVIENSGENRGFAFFHVVAQSPEGEMVKQRLGSAAYLGVLAATNFKQRVRKMIEYYHADRLNYAVAGTPNRLEFDQGFFVKLGDGAADLKPIAHLYKSQVYQLAEFLEVPESIRNRPPTTDTYSLPQGQDEFYFSLPYEKMDLCLYAKNHGYKACDVAPLVELSTQQVEFVFKDIDAKRVATRYLHAGPVLMEAVSEIEALK